MVKTAKGKKEENNNHTSTSGVKPSNLQILVMYLISRSGKTAAINRIASAPFVRAKYICQASITNSLHKRGHCTCKLFQQSLSKIILRANIQQKYASRRKKIPSLLNSLSSPNSQSLPYFMEHRNKKVVMIISSKN